MDIQLIIVLLIVAVAIAFAGKAVYRRSRSFSAKKGCEAGCGCSSDTAARKAHN